MVLVLTAVVLLSISFSNYALTTKTTNIIQGSAPYLTFDGGLTQATNSEALVGIYLSDGRTFTPTTNDSSFDNPIVLPVAGQSFNDIGMFIPTNTDSIALTSVIGPPNNYWGDDDGDGQGTNDITATGNLSLSIVDKLNHAVSHNEVLTNCNSPYKLTLSNTEGTLKTRYGVPNESRFSASNATYYINPKAAPEICFAKPSLQFGGTGYKPEISAGPADIWHPDRGFLTQSVTPSSYGLNFPTTGANGLYFDLEIGGNNQDLYWEPVKHSGITATMTNSTKTSVHVTLTGPAVTDSEQQRSDNPDEIDKPSLPQTFELVGRDSSGNAVVKYGFVLKLWFVNRGKDMYTYSNVSSWCTKIGYQMPHLGHVTNSNCEGYGTGPHCLNMYSGVSHNGKSWSQNNSYMRDIEVGFFAEWGKMANYTGANFELADYWVKGVIGSPPAVAQASVGAYDGFMSRYNFDGSVRYGFCSYPLFSFPDP
ncbi:hypothetical protein [Gilliamella apis]|uniref:hypothetical protein n=1 Tax=Gilliamella apis TaxID=1970738 RepID=UPI000A334EAB|nr:hypothetical protein [Gilliamella apis]OTQ55417.1 hypothetical protein B6D21_06815 [Gilliamella apis]